MTPATNCSVCGRRWACSGVSGRNRAQEQERGEGASRRHAETPETMLCQDDGNGGGGEWKVRFAAGEAES